MRVFTYLRVSTTQQLDKNGLDRQREVVKSFTALKGWSIARELTDQKSGGAEFAERLKLLEMLELAPAFNIEAIVVERADRIARDLMTQEVFFARCAQQKLLVYAADSGQELTCPGADPTKIMLRQIMGVLAQWEKCMLVCKLQDGRRRTKLKTGRPCGGTRRYGDAKDPKQRAEELLVLRYIRLMRHRQRTFLEIARRLMKKKVANPSGGKYWHASTVYRIFTSSAEGLTNSEI